MDACCHNHGIGFDTAAIELLLPTHGESLGLRGKICEHWALNPHPTLIPAIESGWVKSVHCFGSEVGMDEYVRAHPDVFFTGRDGSLRSNRVLCQLSGQDAVDGFIGSTLLGHIEVDNFLAAMANQKQAVQNPEVCCDHTEEIHLRNQCSVPKFATLPVAGSQ